MKQFTKSEPWKRPFRLFLLTVLLCFLLEAATAPVSAAVSFSDVPESHWAHDNIAVASEDGVIQGYSDGTFKPSAPVTLAHFITMMSRAFYPDELKDALSENVSPWYAGAEAVGENHDLFWSVGADMNDPLSRYDMAAVVYNVLYNLSDGWWITEKSISTASESIQDFASFPTDETRDTVSLVYKLGILGGYADGTFRGGVTLNRGQAAAVYCRMKEVLNSINEEARNDQEECLNEFNNIRAEAGLSPLTLSDTLTTAAWIRAVEIEESLSHTRPDGTNWRSVLDEVDAEYTSYGEYISYGDSGDNEEALAELLLNADFTQMGISFLIGLDEEDSDSYIAIVFTDSVTDSEQEQEPEPEPVITIPTNGETYRNSAYKGAACTLKIIPPDGDNCTFVKIYGVSGSQEIHAVSVFIHPGKTASVKLPAGSYVIKVAYGSADSWQGDEKMFGSSGTYSRLNNGGSDKFTFERGIEATLTLMSVVNGNVGSRSESPESF